MKKTLLFAAAFALSMGAMADVAKKDTCTYESKGKDGYLKLENTWLYSFNHESFGTADKSGVNNPTTPSAWGGNCRSIAAKDGIVYAPVRSTTPDEKPLNALVRYNAETGEKMDTMILDDMVFRYPAMVWDRIDTITVEGQEDKYDTINLREELVPIGLPMQDAAFDAAGNLLVCNLVTNMGASPFQVWNIDVKTGDAEPVLHYVETEESIISQYGAIRFDAFAVYGDINGDAIIMAGLAGQAAVAKWTIEGGEFTEWFPEYIAIQEGDLYPSSVLNLSTAPRVYIADENNFYTDGKDSYPTLFNMEGTLIDGFQNDTKNFIDSLGIKGNTNGICEFNIGSDYFLVMKNMGESLDGGAEWASSFEVFKFADENRSFAEMEHLWSFPKDKTGGKNGAFIANICVDVDQEKGEAHLYVYSSNQAMGAYKVTRESLVSVDKVEGESSMQVYTDGRLSEMASEVKVYSATGALVMVANNVERINLATAGVYVVKTVDMNGNVATNRMIVK